MLPMFVGSRYLGLFGPTFVFHQLIICREHVTHKCFCCCCCFYNARTTVSLLCSPQQCTHTQRTHSQSVPINIFHRAFYTKLIKRNRRHYQHRQRGTALTALQTALRPRHRKMNDRMWFVDDPHNLFFYSSIHMCASYRLMPCSRYFQEVGHKLHYRYLSCSLEHVLAGRKRWRKREGAIWRKAGRK